MILTIGVTIGIAPEDRESTWDMAATIVATGRFRVLYSSGGLDLMAVHTVDCPGSDGTNNCQCHTVE